MVLLVLVFDAVIEVCQSDCWCVVVFGTGGDVVDNVVPIGF